MKFIYFQILVLIITVMIFGGCRKQPQTIIQTKERIVTSYDTIEIKSTDTVPCDDFETYMFSGTDTVFVEVEKQKLIVKTVVKKDTVYRTTETIVLQPQAKKQTINIDSNNKNKRNIGGDNKSGNVTNKSKWFWIFFAGVLSMFTFQNVVWKYLKTKFPILKVM